MRAGEETENLIHVDFYHEDLRGAIELHVTVAANTALRKQGYKFFRFSIGQLGRTICDGFVLTGHEDELEALKNLLIARHT